MPHHSSNFEIQKYYQNEPKFNGVYSRNNCPKINDRAYAINLDEFKSIGAHWIALFVNDNNGTYLNSCGVQDFPEAIKKSHRKQRYHNKYL